MPSAKSIAMLTTFQNAFIELKAIIEERKYDILSNFSLDVPTGFNWVRDVFEPLIVEKNADRIMLELVSDEPIEPALLTYQEGLQKCNQLLNLLRAKGVKQGDRVFTMCGLDPGLWISYLTAIKGGYVLIPAASILTVDDLMYRFQVASPGVFIADKENAGKIEQALLSYNDACVKLLLDGKREGWISLHELGGFKKDAVAADTKRDEDLFWFFTSGTTGMPKVVAHTHASYPLGHLTTAAWIGLGRLDKHYNISQPGWAKFA